MWNILNTIAGCVCIYLLVYWALEFRRANKTLEETKEDLQKYSFRLEEYSKMIEAKGEEIENLKREIRDLKRKQEISKAAHFTFGIGKKRKTYLDNPEKVVNPE